MEKHRRVISGTGPANSNGSTRGGNRRHADSKSRNQRKDKSEKAVPTSVSNAFLE